ncbi:hypothetical protein FA09DRAFT_295335 [Tilletiopsis washingtonensis]|uniref:Uncharacterized protein n=1 Tax=Tilletiopsis washingtonensis TaxID=58919 RepID=A0A316ZDA2_9BASI|nr:hypothetical protein FA09DRAFT_295335 [Tilletiopsis washingtonensis]PWN99511.1 hypothetical protein FA09DRAFT_295335 [Tilletiopsis washingtonensis]
MAQVTPSNVAPRGPDPSSRVYWKLGLFSSAMFAAPLSAYFLSVDRLFSGNPTYAGGLAALVANVVLVGYVIAAFLEDQGPLDEGDRRAARGESRKDQ